MIGKQLLLTAAVAGLLLAGCDQSSTTTSTDKPAKTAKSTPATQPADGVVAESGSPAAKVVPQAVVSSTIAVREPNAQGYIVQTLYEFPRARLHINKSDNTAVLYSDDPKTAIERGYNGNSYYLVISLDKSDAPLKLDGFRWSYKASSAEHRDSSDGIFIEGQRVHLQPSDIEVGFQGEGRMIRVAFRGEFTKFDMSSTQPANTVGTPVAVQGMVDATVDSE